jgi:hypothetical protein
MQGYRRSRPEGGFEATEIGHQASGRKELRRLAGPVIVLATSVDSAFASAFLTKLLACRTAAPAQPLLGYTGYCTDVVRAFFDRSARALAVAAS